MSTLWGQLAGIVTVVVMLAFIGIWVWAWLPYHKRKFDELAKLPMEDDQIPPKRAELASPQGARALGRPGGAEIPTPEDER